MRFWCLAVAWLGASAVSFAAGEAPPSPEVVVNHIAELIAHKLGAKSFVELQQRSDPETRKQIRGSVDYTLAATRRLAAGSPAAYRGYAACVMSAQSLEAKTGCDAKLMDATQRSAQEAQSILNKYNSCLKAAPTPEAQQRCEDAFRKAQLGLLRQLSPELAADYDSCLQAARTPPEQKGCEDRQRSSILEHVRRLQPDRAPAFEACLDAAPSHEAWTSCLAEFAGNAKR